MGKKAHRTPFFIKRYFVLFVVVAVIILPLLPSAELGSYRTQTVAYGTKWTQESSKGWYHFGNYAAGYRYAFGYIDNSHYYLRLFEADSSGMATVSRANITLGTASYGSYASCYLFMFNSSHMAALFVGATSGNMRITLVIVDMTAYTSTYEGYTDDGISTGGTIGCLIEQVTDGYPTGRVYFAYASAPTTSEGVLIVVNDDTTLDLYDAPLATGNTEVQGIWANYAGSNNYYIAMASATSTYMIYMNTATATVKYGSSGEGLTLATSDHWVIGSFDMIQDFTSGNVIRVYFDVFGQQKLESEVFSTPIHQTYYIEGTIATALDSVQIVKYNQRYGVTPTDANCVGGYLVNASIYIAFWRVSAALGSNWEIIYSNSGQSGWVLNEKYYPYKTDLTYPCMINYGGLFEIDATGHTLTYYYNGIPIISQTVTITTGTSTSMSTVPSPPYTDAETAHFLGYMIIPLMVVMIPALILAAAVGMPGLLFGAIVGVGIGVTAGWIPSWLIILIGITMGGFFYSKMQSRGDSD